MNSQPIHDQRQGSTHSSSKHNDRPEAHRNKRVCGAAPFKVTARPLLAWPPATASERPGGDVDESVRSQPAYCDHAVSKAEQVVGI